MLEAYMQIFYTTGEQMAQLIIPVFSVYLILSLIGSLLFDRK